MYITYIHICIGAGSDGGPRAGEALHRRERRQGDHIHIYIYIYI